MDKTEMTALIVVGVMIAMDYFTGLLKALKNHDVSSVKMREGLYHKGAYVVVMALAEVIEHAQHAIDLGFSMPIVVPAAVYITLTETSSIIENLGEINPELQGSRLLVLFRSDRGSGAE